MQQSQVRMVITVSLATSGILNHLLSYTWSMIESMYAAALTLRLQWGAIPAGMSQPSIVWRRN
jgi:hypothetical protein